MLIAVLLGSRLVEPRECFTQGSRKDAKRMVSVCLCAHPCSFGLLFLVSYTSRKIAATEEILLLSPQLKDMDQEASRLPGI